MDRTKTTISEHDKYSSLPIRGLVFIQVKGGESYAGSSKKRPDHIEINLTDDYIKKHRPRWNSLQGPAILVYVDTVNMSKTSTHGGAT